MNIVVCLKQTFDTETKISLNSDGKINDVGKKDSGSRKSSGAKW